MKIRVTGAMTVAVLVGWAAAGTAPAFAEGVTPRCYTLASLNGTYAVVAKYGANVAEALGVRHFDGKGNLTGTYTLNAPDTSSTTGARKIITGTQMGTYVVNCDGTGTETRYLTSSTGVTVTQTDDFLITQAEKIDDNGLLATALDDMQRTPSALVTGGLFVMRSFVRRPE